MRKKSQFQVAICHKIGIEIIFKIWKYFTFNFDYLSPFFIRRFPNYCIFWFDFLRHYQRQDWIRQVEDFLHRPSVILWERRDKDKSLLKSLLLSNTGHFKVVIAFPLPLALSFLTLSSTSGGIVTPLPNVQIEFPHSSPDPQLCALTWGCDDRRAPTNWVESSPPASGSDPQPATGKIVLLSEAHICNADHIFCFPI